VSLFTINSDNKNQQQESSSIRNYAILYAVSLLTLLLVTGSINLLVDPHGRLLLLDVVGFNSVKFIAESDTRTGKAGSLRQCAYDTVLFGSSRVESGLDSKYEGLNGGITYNAGLKATSMYETSRLAGYMLGYQQPSQVIIGLDLLMFNQQRREADDFMTSPLVEHLNIYSLFEYAVSLQMLRLSYYTVKFNRNGSAQACADRPHRSSGREVTPRQAFDVILNRYVSSPTLYGSFYLSDEYVQRLGSLLHDMLVQNVNVQLFISPIHALQTEVLIGTGLLSDYETWKRQLVSVVDQVNRESAADSIVSLWDFSGYNEITTELVPGAGQKETMRWYSDSAHYRSEVGNFILDQLVGSPTNARPLRDGFGVLLKTDNIDAHLSQQSSDALRYRAEHPEEVLYVADILSPDSY
jgi:hypothetical protein